MKGLYLVEPVVALFAFSAFLVSPLMQQYIYRRIWEQVTNTDYPDSDKTSICGGNNSTNQTSGQEDVQKQASLFFLYSDLSSIIPSLIVTLMLVAYSDRGGRKITIILPLFGTLIDILSFLTVSYFKLNIYLLIGTSLITSLFGGMGTFLGGCLAYIADLCKDDRQRTMRMAGMDMMIGLFSGSAPIIAGYFLRAEGFNWPFLTAALCQVLIILYAIFILEETVKKVPADAINLDGPPQRSALKQMIFSIYQIFASDNNNTRTFLIFLISIFISYAFAYVGGLSLIILYELNNPLCWTEILIGYGSALSTTVYLGSFVGISVLTYCGAPPLAIVLLGILSFISGMVLLAFTKTTLLMFLVRLPMLLSVMPFPVLRSLMSKIISKSEQGALFACLSFLEMLCGSISNAIFNSVYAGTVRWYPGFVFLLSAIFCLFPLLLLGVVKLKKADLTERDGTPEPVLSGEVDSAEYDENSRLLN